MWNLSAAQEPSQNDQRSAPAPAMSGVIGIDAPVNEDDTGSTMPAIPPLLGGAAISTVFRGEQERSNYLLGGINVGATYDDNASLASHGAISNSTYSVFPNIALEQTFPRLRWTLGYAAGLTVNQRLTNSNQGSHDLNFDSQFRLSPHVNLRVAENFAITTGFFDSGTSAIIGNGGPNASVFAPLSRQRSSSTVLQADYHYALRDIIGVSGSFYDLHFSDVVPGAILSNTRTASGSAFWLHGLVGRDWIGATYRFERLTFDPSGQTNVHSLLVVDTIDLPSRFTLTGFVGPEYTDNRGLFSGGTGEVSHFTDLSASYGIEGGWREEHTSVNLGYSRRISDGGGILDVVRLQGVHGELRQEILRGWIVGVSASYGQNQALTIPVLGSPSSIKSAGAGAVLEHNLGRKLAMRLGYAHEFQDQSGAVDPDFQGGAHRNRFFLTLGYQWARPLGR